MIRSTFPAGYGYHQFLIKYHIFLYFLIRSDISIRISSFARNGEKFKTSRKVIDFVGFPGIDEIRLMCYEAGMIRTTK